MPETNGPLSFLCSGKVDESAFYVSPDELNANPISNIKTFKSSYQLSFHRRVEEASPGSVFRGTRKDGIFSTGYYIGQVYFLAFKHKLAYNEITN